MLDLDLLRTHPDRVRAAMRDKRLGNREVGAASPDAVDRALDADARRRDAVTRQQALQEQQGVATAQIGPLMQAGRRDDAAPLVAESNRLKAEIKAVIETRIVAGLGMKKRDFALARELVAMDNDECSTLQSVIRETFAALGVGQTLNWLDAVEAAAAAVEGAAADA